MSFVYRLDALSIFLRLLCLSLSFSFRSEKGKTNTRIHKYIYFTFWRYGCQFWRLKLLWCIYRMRSHSRTHINYINLRVNYFPSKSGMSFPFVVGNGRPIKKRRFSIMVDIVIKIPAFDSDTFVLRAIIILNWLITSKSVCGKSHRIHKRITWNE